jgi:hypothetical protein
VPLLSPHCPPSSAHRLVSRIAVFGLSAVGIAFGGWQARECAAIRFGYAAGYAYAAAVFWAIAMVGIGLILLVYWRTRGIGVGLVAAGLLSCATFYGGMEILLRLDRVAWQHEPPLVAIGPDQPASLVIYFRAGTTEQQVEEFHSSVLTDTTEQSYVREYLRLVPSQANGHWGVALTFNENTRPEDVKRFIEKIERNYLVEKTYRNIAPTAIQRQSDSASGRK